MPRFSQLSDWLAWLETLHPQAIDLGLSRIYQVANNLNLLQPSSDISHEYSGALAINDGHVFTVAGTNGKGSCVATIEHVLLAQDYKVASFTSPHLHHYSERIRIGGKPVEDALICEAFAAIDQARGDVSLTYFEFGTLAALWIFVQQQIPYVVLEVGLGGRLDAVNIVDTDIAIVTSIAVDHEEWLGSDREIIALEKLGVAREQKPTVITEQNLTQSLSDFIQAQEVSNQNVFVIDQHFSVTPLDSTVWQWKVNTAKNDLEEAITLPLPTLPLNSVAAGLQALHISKLLPHSTEQRSLLLSKVLTTLNLTGRYQTGAYRNRTVVFDVAHNPAAAQVLSDRLQLDQRSSHGNTIAVFAVMDDKDILSIVKLLASQIDQWFVGELAMNERAASTALLSNILQDTNQCFHAFDTIEQAFDEAINQSNEHDRIVVFGSFFTVAAIQSHSG